MQVGQQVWVYEERIQSSSLSEATVTKVGKKYFEVDNFRGRFYLETLIEDAATPTSRVYLSKQDYDDVQELKYLEGKLRSIFKMYGRTGLSLEQLRQINKIIQDGKDN